MKTCSKCGEAKPPGDFYRDKKGADGSMAQCKVCNNAKVKEWASRNRTSRCEASKRWQSKNKDLRAEAGKLWAAKAIEGLADCYVANILSMPVGACPPSLLEKKREQLLMRRLAKQMRSASFDSSTTKNEKS